tara:strand:+ start:165 stop:758 length:594 start_codon:yes stop_codon:yes gene_type:complete
MKLTKEIFDTFDGKAGNHFEEMEVSTYAEIGTREGNTFKQRTPFISKFALAVDCWDLYETAAQNDMGREREYARQQYENLKNYYSSSLFTDNRIEIARNFSNDPKLFNKFKDNHFDCIFIDGDHSYKGVKDDLNNWWDKCNTLFYGHDYMLEETIWNGVKCDVKKAVDEFIKEHESKIKHFRVYTGSANPTWFIWKN